MDGILFFEGLSTNYTVIGFDNRSIGNTTVGSKNFTILLSKAMFLTPIFFWVSLRFRFLCSNKNN